MLLAQTSKYEITDLDTGIVYCKMIESDTVKMYRDTSFDTPFNFCRDKYAKSLWAYLESNLTIKPKE